MTELQKFVDNMSAVLSDERAKYHLTLGDAIKKAESMMKENAETFVAFTLDDVQLSPGKPDSYRGYYSDLAFAPTALGVTLREFLVACKGALGKTFEGYKGGDFLMTEKTPLWIAGYGEVPSIAIMDLVRMYGFPVLIVKRIDF